MGEGSHDGWGAHQRAELLRERMRELTRWYWRPRTSRSRAQLWRQSVRMLRKGFECGSIITVDDECGRYGAPWSRRYIYNQKQCPACKGPVRSWSMSNRTVYCCETCQPLDTNQRAALPAARAKALGAAGGAKLFASHCAPDRGADVLPEKMRVAELRSALDALGLNTQVSPRALLVRLGARARARCVRLRLARAGHSVRGARTLRSLREWQGPLTPARRLRCFARARRPTSSHACWRLSALALQGSCRSQPRPPLPKSLRPARAARWSTSPSWTTRWPPSSALATRERARQRGRQLARRGSGRPHAHGRERGA